jgi:hypothetical protein
VLCVPPCRLELSRGDLAAVKAGLDKARGLCDKGGDWERKNKLKVGGGGEAAPTLARLAQQAARVLSTACAGWPPPTLPCFNGWRQTCCPLLLSSAAPPVPPHPPQVYESVFLMATRQFKRAAELLLDAIATFTRWPPPAAVGGWRCSRGRAPTPAPPALLVCTLPPPVRLP